VKECVRECACESIRERAAPLVRSVNVCVGGVHEVPEVQVILSTEQQVLQEDGPVRTKNKNKGK
jgi:hypothetical protein